LIAIVHILVVVLLGSSGDTLILVVETMREVKFSITLVVMVGMGEGLMGSRVGIGVDLAVLFP
jgi:hypothetical protein